ncbi:MAG TPA: hydrogenase maturation protease [Thermoanaerobaculia bacterium]|nr:hydrogenase maturation protease [Thermoanaerobaculia bacterium]
MSRTAILGLGSVLMGDDAAGPHVLRRLEAEYELPSEIEILDLGTPGPELAHIVEGLDALIVIDTIKAPGDPGDLHVLRRAEILSGNGAPDRLSPHDPSLRGALVAASLLGRSPEDVLLIGIVPGDNHLGIGLSPGVRSALWGATALVAAELARLGYEVPRRKERAGDKVWWEKD